MLIVKKCINFIFSNKGKKKYTYEICNLCNIFMYFFKDDTYENCLPTLHRLLSKFNKNGVITFGIQYKCNFILYLNILS